ncbi:MAG: DUF1499 domain-containing protein [Leptolyngbya sp. SIO1D8]|nr:DUF1499 domain-containing protein [Leptolyngbya sp. SIO1D8]
MAKAFKTFILASLLGAVVFLGFPQVVHAEPASMIAALPGFKAIFGGTRPNNIGVKDGQLAPCPTSPNCVVSQGETDAEHAIAPLTYTGDTAAALTTLRQVIETQPNSEIIEQTDTYLYAEFTSRLMGFVDDVEFYLDPATPGTIHVRAAARLGQSDLGVNRKRIETIRVAFAG